MTLYELVEALTLAASGFGLVVTLVALYRMLTTGRAATRLGAVTRAKQPRRFRLLAGFYLLACAVLAAAGGLAAHRLATGASVIGRPALSLPAGFADSRLPWMLAGALTGLLLLAALRRRR